MTTWPASPWPRSCSSGRGHRWPPPRTLAVSLIPSLFGRSLLGPIADRFPYRHVLIAANVVRAALVGVIIVAVAGGWSLASLLTLLFVLELAGGPAVTSMRILLTDLFEDRRLFTRAVGLNNLSEQVNQVIGLGVGGVIVFAVGATNALWFDLATFLISALVVALAIAHRPVVGIAERRPARVLPGHRRRRTLPRPSPCPRSHAHPQPRHVVGHRGARGCRPGLRGRVRRSAVRRAADGRTDGRSRARPGGHRPVAAAPAERSHHHPRADDAGPAAGHGLPAAAAGDRPAVVPQRRAAGLHAPAAVDLLADGDPPRCGGASSGWPAP